MKGSIFAPNRTIVERDKIDTPNIEIYVHSPSQLKYNVAGLNLTYLSLLHRTWISQQSPFQWSIAQHSIFATVNFPMVNYTTFYFPQQSTFLWSIFQHSISPQQSAFPWQIFQHFISPTVSFSMVNFPTFYFPQQSAFLF